MSERRSKAEERMIRRMTKLGGRGFRVLRSAEVSLRRYQRPNSVARPAPQTEGDRDHDK